MLLVMLGHRTLFRWKSTGESVGVGVKGDRGPMKTAFAKVECSKCAGQDVIDDVLGHERDSHEN